MPRHAAVQLNKDAFIQYLPQFSDIPEVDLRVMMWHFLGCGTPDIASRLSTKKEDVEIIIDKYDPQRTLSLNREVKLAYIDHTVLDIAASLITTITAKDISELGSVNEKVGLIGRLLTIHRMLKPHLPDQSCKGGASAAIGRLKDGSGRETE